MRYQGRYLPVFLVIVCLLAGCGGYSMQVATPTPWEPSPRATPPVPADLIGQEQLVRLGEETYAEHCASCHREDGSGSVGIYPALDGNAPVTEAQVMETLRIMQRGHAGMPGFSEQLTYEEIIATLRYIRNAWTNDADALEGGEAPAE